MGFSLDSLAYFESRGEAVRFRPLVFQVFYVGYYFLSVANYELDKASEYLSKAETIAVQLNRELLIANVNKAAAEIRSIFDKNNGKMGVQGSVAFGFTQQGVFLIEHDKIE